MKQDLNRLRKRFLEGQFAASFMHLELGNMRKIAGRQEKARQGSLEGGFSSEESEKRHFKGVLSTERMGKACLRQR